jgi:hypothetical protein
MTLSLTREPKTQQTEIAKAVARLDAWLDTMRCEDPVTGLRGYGGPVSHWWRSSLLYAGPGLDWRYEGIIAGYLNLWRRTGDLPWLDKAIRAGDDLVHGQLEDGHFAASAFEANPATGGTPHEASCDIGLLLLAKELRDLDIKKVTGSTRVTKNDDGRGPVADWRRYSEVAERNLRAYYLDKLWDRWAGYLRDHPREASFVPNKAATASQAFFLMAELTDEDSWIERYSLPTLQEILKHQVREGAPLQGAIAQNSFGTRIVEKYFPYYIARCVPALVQGYQFTGDDRFIDAALAAMSFIARHTYPDGSPPQVVYPGGQNNRYPSWVAPLADVLRAADLLKPYGFDIDLSPLESRLLDGQDQSGGFQTATGFAAQTGGQPPSLPDVRDVLHVVGWCDKVFRYLSEKTGSFQLEELRAGDFEAGCVFQGRQMNLKETMGRLEISADNQNLYLWCKSESWPRVSAPEFWMR